MQYMVICTVELDYYPQIIYATGSQYLEVEHVAELRMYPFPHMNPAPMDV